MTMEEVWSSALDSLYKNIPAVGYNTYIKNAAPVKFENGNFTLAVPMEITKNMICMRYKKDIENALSKISGQIVSINIILEGEAENYNTEKQNQPAVHDDAFFSDPLNPEYTFDNFVIGPSNQYACALAMNTAKFPGQNYNPLFLYGNSGLGKTHLLHAIGNEILRRNPNTKVLYLTSERFVNDMIASINEKNTAAFRQHYRNIDVLLLDDVQFIAGKDGTQEEFFHTFNELYNNNKQIVLTSDRKPKDLVTLEERLRTRFEWGVPTDIINPDFETRVAILKKEASSSNITIDEEIFRLIAEKITSSVRELKGALTKIISFSSINHIHVSLQKSEELLQSFLQDDGAVKITDKMIIDKVCTYYSVSKQDVFGTSRMKNVTLPRQVAMYLCKTLTDMNFVMIGNAFGGKDRTTVMHNVDKIMAQIKKDEILKSDIECIKKDLTQQ